MGIYVSSNDTVPSRGTLTDASGTAGATSSQLLAANGNRKYLLVHNPTGNTAWINFTTVATTASPSIKLGPNTNLVFEGTFVTTEAMNAIRQGGSDIPLVIKEGS